MSKVREEIDIAAPVEEVFAFFDDVGNAAVLVPAIVEVTRVEELDGGGRRVEYTTRSRGGELVEASSEHLVHDPPRRTVTRGVQSGVTTTSTQMNASGETAGDGGAVYTSVARPSLPVTTLRADKVPKSTGVPPTRVSVRSVRLRIGCELGSRTVTVMKLCEAPS